MRTRLVIAALATLAAAGAVAAEAPSGGFAEALLAQHNVAREEAGVPRLQWSERLAGEAQGWANRLAREGDMRHASDIEANGAGENLWMGSTGYYPPERMVAAFVEEKRHFVAGAFPGVSRTGRWEDVGHYTQVVWRDTREVGCAMARNAQDDFLVCRYWPAGNWMGERPF